PAVPGVRRQPLEGDRVGPGDMDPPLREPARRRLVGAGYAGRPADVGRLVLVAPDRPAGPEEHRVAFADVDPVLAGGRFEVGGRDRPARLQRLTALRRGR